MEYNKEYFKIIPYEVRKEPDLDGKDSYILTFNNSSHLKLNDFAMAVVEKLDGTKSTKQIAKEISKEQGIKVEVEDLDNFINSFLVSKNLIDGIEVEKEKKKNSSSLWIHKPLFESSKLSGLYDVLKVLMKDKKIVGILLSVSFIIVLLSLLETISSSSFNFQTTNSLLILFLVYFSMFFHEIGHVTAAHKYGVEVGKIGVGIYLMYFIFFVDMTNVWKLDKKERIVTDFGGMYFQILTVIPLYLIYRFTNNISFLISIMAIFIGTITNLIPFLRLDGYWLVSDILGIQNVTFNTYKSLKTYFKNIRYKLKNKDHKIALTTTVHGIYSVILSISTLVAIFFIINSTIKIVSNIEFLATSTEQMISSLINLNLKSFLVLLNELFIYLIPVFFLINFIVKFLMGILASIFKKEPKLEV